jgi:hypothetical protein
MVKMNCAGREKSKRQKTEHRMEMAEHGMTAYPLLP